MIRDLQRQYLSPIYTKRKVVVVQLLKSKGDMEPRLAREAG